MALSPNAGPGRLVSVLFFAAIALLVISVSSVGGWFSLLPLGAIVGAGIGFAVARSRPGLGQTEIGERGPEYAGKVGIINMAHIPVIGIGGLGIVAMAVVVALVLPDGRTQLAWGLTGAVIGAAGLLIWRHYHGGSPFEEHPEETLHLR